MADAVEMPRVKLGSQGLEVKLQPISYILSLDSLSHLSLLIYGISEGYDKYFIFVMRIS